MPNKQIDSLVGDIYALLDENTNHEPSEENLKWIGNAVQELLRSRLSARERAAATLRFSSLGRPDRQLWYQTHAPEKAERMLPKTYFKFLYGDMIELLLLFLAKEAGHEVTHEQAEVEVDGVKGHLDAVIDGVTVDCKSASSYSFNKFVSGSFVSSDPFGYIKQLSGYRYSVGTERAGFLVADKVHGDIHFAEVSKEVLSENEPRERIDHLRKVLDSSNEPDRCYSDKPEGVSGNRILDVGCSYCAFKQHCWRDANGGQGLQVYTYSSGPKFLTRVVKEPRVQKEDW
jgi:hypothetical protein